MSGKEKNTHNILAIGAGAGAAIGATVAAATVPIVQMVGFTATGIAAESIAAGIMSSAAIAGGGGVASGSTVAMCQSIGALGVVPVGITAATVAVPAALGLGIAAIVKTHRSSQHESLNANEYHQHRDGKNWIIATEEGWGNVRVCRYTTECAARKEFGKIWCSRVLYNGNGDEIQSAGLNGWAIQTIRRVMKQKHFSN